MLMQFNQAVRINGVTYPHGKQVEVAQEVLKHEHFKLFQKAGFIVPVKKVEPVVLAPTLSPVEKAKKVASKSGDAAAAKGK